MDVQDMEKQLSQRKIEQNLTLQKLLENQNLALFELLSIKNIQSKIRSNLTKFIKYCQKNEQFGFNLIDIGIKCPMHEGSNQNMKNVCYIAADILTCDQDILADLFILPDKSTSKRKDSGNSSEQFQQIQENIQVQNQMSTFAEKKQEKGQGYINQGGFGNRFKYLNKMFEYIQLNETKNLDQNCINYMIKSLNCLIRKKGQDFIRYLEENKPLLQRLVQLNLFSSVNQFFIKILSDDQIEGQCANNIKKTIVQGVLKSIKTSINKEQFIQRLDFLQELYQTNKYASQDDRTELQKLSDVFVSKELIDFFYNSYLSPTSYIQFYNSISYFSTMLKRMNVDQQIDPYSYSNQPKQQTMLFQMDALFKQFQKVVEVGYKNIQQFQIAQAYKKKLIQTKYYEFLNQLTENSRFTNCENIMLKSKHSQILKGKNIIFKNKNQKIMEIKQFLKYFVNQDKNGINRTFIISILQKILRSQIGGQNMQQKIQNKYFQQNKVKEENKVEKKTSIDSKEEKLVQKNGDGERNQTEKQKMDSNKKIVEQQRGDKRSKVNKFKAGLKLDIKKLSIESSEKIEEGKKHQKGEEQKKLKEKQSALQSEEVEDIFRYFQSILKSSQTFNKQKKLKTKNKQTQLEAFLNKIIIILCNSIIWNTQNKSLNQSSTSKSNYQLNIQKMFPHFNFQDLCQKYTILLATNKHPNSTAKQKNNPQLCFIQKFFSIYASEQLKQEQRNQKQKKNNDQLNESDFKSESDEDGAQAVKCTLQDLKKITGFRFQSQQKQNKIQIQIQIQKQEEILKTDGQKQKQQNIVKDQRNVEEKSNIKEQVNEKQKRWTETKEKEVDIKEKDNKGREIILQNRKEQNKDEKLKKETGQMKQGNDGEDKQGSRTDKTQQKQNEDGLEKGTGKTTKENPQKTVLNGFYVRHLFIYF